MINVARLLIGRLSDACAFNSTGAPSEARAFFLRRVRARFPN